VNFPPEFLEVKAVRSWAAHILDVPENFIEPLQLVRYTDGQHIGLLDDLGISMIGRAIVCIVDSFLCYARGRFLDSIW
jgi:hypothetical protein